MPEWGEKSNERLPRRPGGIRFFVGLMIHQVDTGLVRQGMTLFCGRRLPARCGSRRIGQSMSHL
jgi:hypothetical protein